ncbi:4'-phosphopantetheinyl transferase family protein [Methylicorpusculum sp.]|uniref:4'-phosphopantetheinyl transferase family protein n=1 Tax=Methylicorpusculum sp. TaxID=2713644 RepID=UPI002731B0F5|nr:4'-phosphopantetheinyl transferase superfamily protein [Methylicorpusculum sp.]MDP2178903.1 4'-phosphopantetheinyl transferase superfamily protein [Methylicorpusculum sp.]MDP3530288.1 4'-phosphopantetheinyl transferase superfamily protein [Methylicorpusculum sp.]MDZ4151833.1 4'-phosphopantetheinyl transferase superfamily protein [Methylicorpusculum sp.]
MAPIRSAGRLGIGHTDCTSYGTLPLAKRTQKLPMFGEVHIWSARLNATQNKFEIFYGSLSTDERKRAESFVHERDRNRYIIARGILRELLGHYLGIAPEQVCFCYGANGKPHLAESLADSGLAFNLSHAANSALYAFANQTQVGIDIEPLNKGLAWRELAPIVFSAREKAELAEFPEVEKAEAFLRGWTRKEALVKGCGVGLSLDLNAFDVPLGRLENPSPVRLSNKQSDVWWLCPIDPIADFVMALTVNGAPLRVIANHWIDWPTPVNLTVTGAQQSVGAMFSPRLERNLLLPEATWKI